MFPVYGPSSFGDYVRCPARRRSRPAGTTASTSSDSSEARCSRSPTARSSPSGGTTSAATGSGSATSAGNEFYYAHLSAYSPFAVNGNQVKAGTVLGFMGNTGDASTTPYHLHFEIHPVGLLYLGYDGAVNPYTYLHCLAAPPGPRFRVGRRLGAAGLADERSPEAGRDPALVRRDISTADGLDPASLRRALKQPGKSDGG